MELLFDQAPLQSAAAKRRCNAPLQRAAAKRTGMPQAISGHQRRQHALRRALVVMA